MRAKEAKGAPSKSHRKKKNGQSSGLPNANALSTTQKEAGICSGSGKGVRVWGSGRCSKNEHTHTGAASGVKSNSRYCN